MNALLTSLDKMSEATTPAEYLAAQRECIAGGSAEEALVVARTAEAESARRRDCLQVVYWLTPPDERIDRFRSLHDEAAPEQREFLKALLFRALTEKTVGDSHPERLEVYLVSVQQEFAKSLFTS
jgi:hypothetical protein